VNVPKKKTPQAGNPVKWFWVLFASPFLLIALLLWTISINLWGKLPTFDQLENPRSNLASEVISADQVVLGTYFVQNRSNVHYDQISPNVINALVSTEDERFYDHSGIDFKSLARAVMLAGSRGGGSTLTQQLAKNLFRTRNDLFGGPAIQKPAEWIIATRLERQYTKPEILAMYLNTVDWINGAVGIKSAAKVYFNTSPDSLRIEEAAVLVGMVKNPSLYNPRKRPEMVVDRRNTVFYQMKRNGLITEAEFDSLKQLPLGLKYRSTDHNEGLATYFREYLRGEMTKWCETHFKPDGTPYDLYRDGLRIYTTIDSRLQEHAEYAVVKHLTEHQEKFFKDQRSNDKAPFRGISDEEVVTLMEQGMRRSERYNRRMDERQDIRDLYRDYWKVKSQQTELQQEIERIYREVDRAKKLNQEDEVDKLAKKAQGLRDKVKSITPDVDEAWEAYQEKWKPFDDSLKAEFNAPVAMKVFSWKGEIDTLMSPMDSVRYYKHFLRCGLMSIDPHTGFIKAWVGGPNYKHFKYDNVKQGARQVGSTFKPFVYALAIQEGWSPCEKVLNIPVTFERERFGLPQDWTPRNSDHKHDGQSVSLKYALANSINYITAFVMKKFGPQAVIELVRKMGITADIEPFPSICLGTPSISVYEMVAANATFANGGVYTQPVAVTRIEDSNGNVLEEFMPETREVMDEGTAYAMLSLMEGVVQFGSGVRLRYRYKLNQPMGGKTGTTQNNSDGWFMGLTPDLVTGVWSGCEDRAAHFRYMTDGQGASMALPIFAMYMDTVYKDPGLSHLSQGPFDRPKGPIAAELDCKRYDSQHGTAAEPFEREGFE